MPDTLAPGRAAPAQCNTPDSALPAWNPNPRPALGGIFGVVALILGVDLGGTGGWLVRRSIEAIHKRGGQLLRLGQPLIERRLLLLRLAERLEEPVAVDTIEGVRVATLATAALFEHSSVGFGQFDRGRIGRLAEGIGFQHRRARRHAALQVIDISRQELQPLPTGLR